MPSARTFIRPTPRARRFCSFCGRVRWLYERSLTQPVYPIAWALCEGGNVISVDSEMIFYGILDLLAKPVFTVMHLFLLRNVDIDRFQFSSGHFSVYKSVAHETPVAAAAAAAPVSAEKPTHTDGVATATGTVAGV